MGFGLDSDAIHCQTNISESLITQKQTIPCLLQICWVTSILQNRSEMSGFFLFPRCRTNLSYDTSFSNKHSPILFVKKKDFHYYP
jgi:hypothetical protein